MYALIYTDDNMTEDKQRTIFGNVYVQCGMEGLASYHFETDESYISYASAPQFWQLSDGSTPPDKKQFLSASYDVHTRTFEGTVDWSPLNFDGDSKWEYHMVFSEDLLEIEAGEIIRYDTEGKKREEVETFGRDIFYEKLIG